MHLVESDFRLEIEECLAHLSQLLLLRAVQGSDHFQCDADPVACKAVISGNTTAFGSNRHRMFIDQ